MDPTLRQGNGPVSRACRPARNPTEESAGENSVWISNETEPEYAAVSMEGVTAAGGLLASKVRTDIRGVRCISLRLPADGQSKIVFAAFITWIEVRRVNRQLWYTHHTYLGLYKLAKSLRMVDLQDASLETLAFDLKDRGATIPYLECGVFWKKEELLAHPRGPLSKFILSQALATFHENFWTRFRGDEIFRNDLMDFLLRHDTRSRRARGMFRVELGPCELHDHGRRACPYAAEMQRAVPTVALDAGVAMTAEQSVESESEQEIVESSEGNGTMEHHVKAKTSAKDDEDDGSYYEEEIDDAADESMSDGELPNLPIPAHSPFAPRARAKAIARTADKVMKKKPRSDKGLGYLPNGKLRQKRASTGPKMKKRCQRCADKRQKCTPGQPCARCKEAGVGDECDGGVAVD